MAIARVNEDRDTTVLREFAYRGRHAWVSTKEALGLSRRGDQTFYVDRLSRMLRAGALGRRFKIMATGKNDGAGSQAQAAMSAICFAEAHGLEYVHRPFTTIEHPETGMAEWARAWETHFNLGDGERQLCQTDAPVIALDRLPMVPRADDVIVAAQHYLHFCNSDPNAWERVVPLLRKKYSRNKGRKSRAELHIAVHMRRGDISGENWKVARNFTPNASFLAALKRILAIVSAKVPDVRVSVFSQGHPEIFADFSRLGCELRLDEPALATHAELVDADVLVMSKSSFSYTAALLGEGIAVYDPHKYRPLSDWIARTPDGDFDERAFRDRLGALLAGTRR